MCKRLLSHSIPLVICISGSSGTGKSTIASRLRAKLGVSRVISTDTIREEMRSSGRFSQSSFPGLYVSTYESYQLIPDANLSLQEKVESSYLQQCDLVMTEVCSSIQSLILEQKPFILEGVHLSLKHVEEIQRLCSSHIFLSVLLHVEDNVRLSVARSVDSAQDSYINRFSSRVPQGSLDPKTNKYVRHFSAITGIQDYLLRTFSESKARVLLIFSLTCNSRISLR
jgi:2-phosphoglycerate kinase